MSLAPLPPVGLGVVDVLVVDDEAPIRKALVDLLRRQGLTVLAASTGRQALALLADHPVRLLVTDIYMPEMDGLELIVTVATSQPEIRILAMSGGGSFDVPESALQAAMPLGTSRALAKPFEFPVFLAAVVELLAPVPLRGDTGEADSG